KLIAAHLAGGSLKRFAALPVSREAQHFDAGAYLHTPLVEPRRKAGGERLGSDMSLTGIQKATDDPIGKSRLDLLQVGTGESLRRGVPGPLRDIYMLGRMIEPALGEKCVENSLLTHLEPDTVFDEHVIQRHGPGAERDGGREPGLEIPRIAVAPELEQPG